MDLYKQGDVVVIDGVTMTVMSDQTMIDDVAPGPVTATYSVPGPPGGTPGTVWGTYWPGQKVAYDGSESTMQSFLLKPSDGPAQSTAGDISSIQAEIDAALAADKAAHDAKTDALESELADLKAQLAALENAKPKNLALSGELTQLADEDDLPDSGEHSVELEDDTE